MKLLEFQAKKMFSESGIPIPEGKLIEKSSDLDGIGFPTVLKAQIPVGGRGKAGVVRVAADKNEAEKITAELLVATVKGYAVNTLLAEDAMNISKEIYICCLNEKEDNRPMFIASKAGGVDIEQLAKASPEKIIRKKIDPVVGLMAFDIRDLAAQLDIPCDPAFVSVVNGLWHILRHQDATLVEINPLAITDKGLVALDGKIILDDNAGFRGNGRLAEARSSQEGRILKNQSAPEMLAEKYDISYVLLDGDIGIIADGAGTGMLTLDLVKDLGGRPANFCEMGGKAAAEAAEQAMEIVLSNPNVKSLLVSLIGGLTRMDQVAEGIDAYLKKNDCRVPVSVRMCGTKAKEGVRILSAHGIAAKADLFETAKLAVQYGGR
jgi:succinyl-CoA synthetase beta subunit